MIEAFVVIAAMALNRVRGGGLGGKHLPGHPRFYVAAAIGLMALVVMPPWKAGAIAAAYLWWSILPWGQWFDLGRMGDEWQGRAQNSFERALSQVCGGNDYLAFGLRNFIGFAPLVMLASPYLAIMAAPIQVLAYEAGWQAQPENPIEPAEFLTGALWGAIILSAI